MDSQPAGDRRIEYDLYISYSPCDSNWVWDWLVPKLKSTGLHIAINDEAFEPGAPVWEEIQRCIASSHKTAVVLSPDWVGDQSEKFASLLVQHEDPGARFRQLIPLLLKPCTPPRWIQLLHWVDFTNPDRQEEQLKRVVNAIQGIADLPELHPERALPDAIQRTWELRWLWVMGFIVVVTFALLSGWIWSQRPPEHMDPEKYGIAIAEFTVIDQDAKPIKSELGSQMARRVAGFIALEVTRLAEVVKSPVQIWGDSPKVHAVTAGSEAEQAHAIDADVLLYGSITQQGDRWLAAPKFFLDQDVVSNNAGELIGEYALGKPISFVSGDMASEGDLTTTMRARARALTELLMGLSYYAQGTSESYWKAKETFDIATQDPEWGASNALTGQEVLYLFLGNALLKLGSLSDEVELRAQYLRAGKEAFQRALEYNPDYPRAYNGLGSLYFQQAQSIGKGDECSKWDWAILEQSAEAFTKALEMTAGQKADSGNVDLRAHLGLGRIRYYQGLCQSTELEPKSWDDAKFHHEAVVKLYMATPLRHLRSLVALSHLDLGDMALYQANWRMNEDSNDPKVPTLLVQAQDQYSSAINLFSTPLNEEDLRLALLAQGQLLTSLCWQGADEMATESLSGFLSANHVPEEMAKALRATLDDNCSAGKE